MLYQIIDGQDWELKKRITARVMKNLNDLHLLTPDNVTGIFEQIKDIGIDENTVGVLLPAFVGMEIQKRVNEICGNPEELKLFLNTIFDIDTEFNVEDADASETMWAWNEFSTLLQKKTKK